MHMPKKILLLLEIIFVLKYQIISLCQKIVQIIYWYLFLFFYFNFLFNYAQEDKKSICNLVTDKVDKTTFCTDVDDMNNKISLVQVNGRIFKFVKKTTQYIQSLEYGSD